MLKRLRHIIVSAILLFGVLETSAQIGMPDTVCVGTTRQYSVNDPTVPSTYTWQIDGVTQTTTANAITITWNSPGQFLVTVQEHTAGGCDGEIQSGIVIVNPLITNTIDSTVCSNAIPFVWNGQNVTGAGTYNYITAGASGCDSTTILNLTINNGTHTTIDVTKCSSYTWSANNQTYTTSGLYNYITTGANGCPDTLTLNLTINNGTNTTIDITKCSSYTWSANNQTYTASGLYNYITTGSNGCPDTLTLNLTINNGTHTTVDVTECSSYTWSANNQTYAASGVYDHITTGTNGCPDTLTLNLTINSGTHTTVDVTECSSYTWSVNNQTYTTSGLHDHITAGANGCPDTLTLNLTINNGTHTTIDVTECSSYTWPANNQTYTTSGLYDYITTGANGCPDTLTLNLTITSGTHTTVDVTECSSYTWSANNQTYTTSGLHDYITTGTNGCPDTLTLNLTINNGTHTTIDVAECSSYTWSANNQTYTTSGLYDHITTGANGCPDTLTLNLTINNGTHTTVDVTECSSYTWSANNQTYTTSGLHDYITTGTNGCPDTLTLNLTINNGTHTTIDVTECSSYTWSANNQTYTTSGLYDYITTGANGCPDTLTLNLTINNGTHTTIDVTECSSYTWSANNQTYTTSGLYDYITTGTNGCPDTLTLNLTINSGTHTTVDVTECSSYTWSANNQTYTTSGLYDHITTGANGCPDTLTLNLTINNGTHTTIDVTECSLYTWSANNQTYTASGLYDHITTGANGCPDTLTLNLTINNGTHTTIDVTECSLYTWSANNQTYTASGLYDHITTGSNGCPDTLTLDLTINNGTHTTIDVTECSSYTWSANNQTYAASGVYDHITTGTNGCPDTLTLNLTINSGTHTTVDVTECSSYTWSVNNQTYTTSGLHDHITAGANGCPDTLTLNLTINNGTHTTIDVTECSSYTWPANNQTYTTSGLYDYITTGANGCPDTLTLNLTITNGTHTTIDVTECSSYTWSANNQTYTTSGLYDYITTGTNGCPDTLTLNLTINNGTHTTIDVTECSSYTWSTNNQTYTTSGLYDYITTGSKGCPDTLTLNLTITNGTHTTIDVTECSSYTWSANNQTYTTSGLYDYITTGTNGCPDTLTLNLTINDGTHTTIDVTECSSYTWSTNNQTYITSGLYDYITTGTNGCPDTLTLNLTITNGTHTTIDVTECSSYTWSANNQTYTTSGLYDYITTGANGCPDTLTLNLTINNGTHTTVDVTECSSYTWSANNQIYTSSGLYDYITTGANGCPDTLTLNLTINNGTHTTIDVTECSSYTWSANNQTYTTSGVHDYITTGANGCPDTLTLNLTITSGTHTTIDVTECSSYTWSANNQAYAASGVYDHITTGTNGCPDTLTLNLTINSGTHTTVDVTECSSYTWSVNNQTYATSGLYDYITTGSNGCPDTLTLNLTINNGTHTTIDVTECSSYTWSANNQTYTTSGLYDYITTGTNGCPDTLTLNLTINNGTHTTIDVTECSSYTWSANNQTYTTSGLYDYITTGTNGCPDTLTLNLTINNGTHTTIDVTECSLYTWSANNQTYTTSGLYDHITTGANGCPDTLTLNLTITSGTHTTIDVTECSSYTWSVNNQTYTTSGLYDYIRAGSNGCPDTLTLNLTINNGTHTTIDVTECSLYTWSANNQTYTASGLYDYITTGANGCPDTLTLNLAITSGTHTTVDVTECSSYTWSANNQTYTTSGLYDYITTGANGCPDTLTLNLTINNGTHTTIDVTECSSYTWSANNQTYTTSGLYDHITTGTNGCPDTLTLNLTITSGTHTTVDVTECSSYTWSANNQTYATSGLYDYITTGANGCPDTLTLNLTINNGTHTTIDVTECSSYTWSANNQTYTTSGLYDYITTGTNGCPDTLTLNLTINNGTHTTVDVTECSSYTWSANNQTYTTSGLYDYITTGTNGCPDTLTLNLTITSGTHTTIDVAECSSYTWPANNQTYTTSGLYDYITTGANGCPDTLTLNLTINNGTHTTIDVTECSSYTWSANNQTYTTSGLYDYITTGANGCPDTLTLNLTINNGTHTTVDVTECSSYTWPANNQTYTTSGLHDYITTGTNGCPDTLTLNLTINNGTHTTIDVTECSSYTWSANNQTYTTSGLYDYITTGANGCPDTLTLNLTINNGTHTTIDITECSSYTWSSNNQTYITSGLYDYITTGANGCPDTLTLNLTITSGTHTTIDVTECSLYTWSANNRTYTTSGLYDYITTGTNGCPDTLTLNLTISNGTHTTIDVTECSSYTWSANNQTYATSGLYDYITTGTNGCPDTLTLNLTINNGTHTTIDVTECSSYTWSANNQTYTTSGLYDYITTGANGCPDTLTLNLTINNGTHTTIDVTECSSYTWSANNQTYTTRGLYDHITTGTNGCPDTLTLNLTITSGTHTTVDVTECSSYTWSANNQTYIASGLYDYITTGTNGCADTLTLNLTINSGTHTTVGVTECSSYTWSANNQTYTTSGLYDYITTGTNGCADTLTLNLTITSGTHTTIDVTECSSYTWSANNQTYTTSGLYDYITTGANGCPDTLTLNLTITSGTHTTVDVTECSSYTWSANNQTYTTSGLYDYITTGTNGCPDTLTLDLTINNGTHTTVDVTECSSYTWSANNQTYTTSGLYDYITTGANGCPDTLTLNLTITSGTHTTVDVTECSSYTWSANNQTYTTSGLYDYITTGANGCPDTLTLNLTITSGTHTTIDVTECSSYTWSANNQTYTTSGLYDYITTGTNGCPDTLTLNLTITSGTHTTIDVTECSSYTWSANNQTYTTSGLYDYITTGANGCPDTLTLNLTITSGTHTTVDVTECSSYTWSANNQTYTTSGLYDYITTGANGCPDTLTLNLTINNGNVTDTTVTACNSFVWDRDGQTYTASGIYDYTFINGVCTDTIRLNLTISNGNLTDTTVTACNSFVWDRDGQTYTASGIYDYTFINGACTDTIRLNLTISNGNVTDTTVTACNSFVWDRDGQTYTASGIYDYTFINGACTDTIRLNLTISNGNVTDTTVTACNSFVWDRDGQTYTASGIYDYTFINGACTDTIRLNLTISTGNVTDTTVTACNSFVWDRDGQTYTASGIYDYTFINGVCTDTIRLNLTISNGNLTDTTVTACNSFVWDRDGQTYTASGIYDYTFINGACTDTIRLNLTISNGNVTDTTVTACNSFVWDRDGQTYTASGIYDYTFINGACTDTIRLNLTISNSNVTDTIVTACNSFVWDRDGQTYTASGIYDYTFINGACTDTIRLNLTISNGNVTDTTVTACNSFVWDRDGQTYTASGIYDYTFINGVCTDTIRLNLTISNGNLTDTTVTACNSFVWDRDGQTYTASGIYDYTFINGACTDTIRLNLTISNGNVTDTTVTACNSFVWDRDGQTYTASGIYDYTFINGACTDTIRLNLTISNGTHTTVDVTECSSYTWSANNQTYTTSGLYDYITTGTNGCPDTLTLDLTINNGTHTTMDVTECSSYTWSANNQTYTTSGLYDYITTGTNGCPDTLTLNLTINNGTHTTVDVTECSSYTWSANNQTYTTSGLYDHITTGSNGCPDTLTLNLTITNGTQTMIDVTECSSYTWSANNQTYAASGLYDYITTGSNGCPDTLTLNLTISNGNLTDTTVTACNSFVWDRDGQTYTASGIYDYTFINGVCTDTIRLNLTISNGNVTDTTVTACNSFVWDRDGQTYTASGIYDYTFINGTCTDTIRLNLTISNGNVTDTTVTACNSFVWDRDGQTYTASGIYDYTFINGACTDTIRLNLTISTGNVTDTTVTACNSFVWDRDGQTYTASGIYDYTFINGACTDTIRLNLTISNGNLTDTTVTACNSFVWDRDGQTYTASGIYDYTFINGACTDTIRLNLTISNGNLTDTTVTACNSFVWDRDGQTYTASGIYDYTFINGACTDTIRLNLTISNGNVTDTTVTACNSFVWDRDGQTYTASGIYDYTFINGVCTDTIRLNLTISNGNLTDTTVTACNSFVWDRDGQTYTASGIYDYTFINGACTDTIRLNLTISNGNVTDTTVTACNSFVWDRDGQTYTASGIYDYTFINGACTDTIRLNLTISNGNVTDTTVTACNSFVWDRDGQTYTASGIYDYTFINGACTDTIRLNLTISTGNVTDTTVTACNSFVWDRDGQTYTASGIYDYTFINGVCTDTIRLNLTISNGNLTDTTVTACNSFVWDRDGQTYTASGIYDYTFINGACTDTIRLNLTISNGNVTDTTVTACNSFVWDRDGQTYTASGIYDYTFINGACTDTIRLNLTISNSNVTDTIVTACNSFVWDRDGQTYTASGIYDYTFINGACTDTIRLNLTISNGNVTDTTVTACNSFVWDRDGQTYTASGIYDYTFINGVCTDTIRLNLTITSGTHTTIDVTKCSSYTWSANNQTYTTSGLYDHITTGTNGCPDTLTLNLIINNGTHTTIAVTECSSYTWSGNNQTYTTSGLYDYITTGSNGCPDTLTLNLTINNGTHTTIDVTECSLYTWSANNQTYTASGLYDYITTGANGCPDTLTLNLAITSGTHTTVDVTECSSYTWSANNQTYTTSGLYDYITTGSNGCPDTLTLNLTINNGTHTTIDVTECSSYTWSANNQTYTTSGLYDYITTGSNGCPDTLTLNLTINNGTHTTIDVTECSLYTWSANNQTYTTSGLYDYITMGSNGCPDTLTLNLTINNGTHTTIDVTECSSYTWSANNQIYTTSGLYDYITTGSNGCPDTLTLNLTINNGTHTTIDVTECSSYTWPANNQTYTTSGLYDYITTGSNGCPDTLTLNLTINNGTHTTIDVTECSSYTWSANNQMYTTSGVYDHITTGTNGCPDTLTLNLTINNGTHTTMDVTECSSYTWSANNQTYTTSGLYDYITTGTNGCPDTLTLNLTINNGTHTTIDVTECSSYTWSANNQTYTTSGLYDYITTGTNGCPDTLTLNLTINNGTHTTIDVTECSSYTWWANNQTYTTSGLYDHITTGTNGCPDTLTLNLTINNGTHTTVDVTECSSYTWSANNQTYTTSGLYDYIRAGANGCPDTLTLNLTINNGTHTTVDVTECSSYTWSANNQTYTTSGLYDYIRAGANGCPDTLTLNLTINNGTHTTVDVTECSSYTWSVNNQTYTTSGLYDYITTGANGCADTLTLNLTLQSAPTLIITNPPGVCAPATVDITSGAITTGSDVGLTYTYWTDANTTIAVNNPKAIAISGTYYIKATNQGGCSTTKLVKVTINNPPTVNLAGAGTICAGSATTLMVSFTGTAPFRFTYTDGANNYTVGPIAATSYQLTVEPDGNTTYTINSIIDAYCSSTGNLSSATITVIPPLQSVRYPTLTTEANIPLQLNARDLGVNYTYSWNPPTGLSSSSIINPTFNYNKKTEYTIAITSASGCTAVDTLLVLVRENTPATCNSDIFVPRAWTPNGDAHNDKLHPLTVCIRELKYFRIFNRWGQLVFETNIMGYGWDGIFRGSPQVSDVYTWTVEAVGVDGKHYKRTGTSVLLR